MWKMELVGFKVYVCVWYVLCVCVCVCGEPMKSGRRYRAPLANKNMFKRSFIPNAVKILNSVSK